MTATDHRLSYEGSNRELADHLRDGHGIQVPEEGRNALDSGWWSDLDAQHAAAHADPTRPLSQRTPDEVIEFADNHLLMALEAADWLQPDRQLAEDYVRDRLVALSDTYPEAVALAAENRRRTVARLTAAVRARS